MRSSSWRNRRLSKRHKFVSVLSSAEDVLKTEGSCCLNDFYHFFVDFWASTPHPFAQMFLVVGWATAVAVLNDPQFLDLGIELDPLAGRTMTTIIAFLIVFRTNQSYNRWWEGRILWGKMHWSCVELSQLAAVWIDDARLARRIMNFSIAYAYTVKQCLRRESLKSQDLDNIVAASEVEKMSSMAPPVVPYYCTDVIRQCIKRGLTEHPQAYGAQAVARGIDIPVSTLASQFADMARVRNTPQPDCFRVMLHMFTLVYLLLLPIVSYEYMGYWVIPEVLFTSYLMLGLQLAAKYLEDPFGYDLSDLDLDLYVNNIADHCRSAFYLGEKGGFDLTLDDGGAEPRDVSNDNDDSDNDDDGPDHGQITSPFGYAPADGSGPSWKAPKSPDTMAPVSSEMSPGDPNANSTSENTPPSPSSRSGHSRIISSTSEEIYAPQLPESFPGARSKGAAVGHNSMAPRADPLSERAATLGKAANGKAPAGNSAPRMSLSFRHRTQEETVPRRRTKPRPGRGRAPLENERSLSPQRVVNKCSFEKQGPPKSAEVV